MENQKYEIEIAEFNSAGIRAEAAKHGITHMRYLGGNNEIGIYALPLQNGAEIRVANTNGDPVWEEADTQEFAKLLEEIGFSK